MSKIYKYKGRKKLNIRGKDISYNQEVVIQAYDTHDLGDTFKLLRSSNDQRGKNYSSPEEVDWALPTMELKDAINELSSALFSALKYKMHGMGCTINLSSEMPTYKSYTIEHMIDFAFDCGWTGELDNLDASNEKVVKRIVSKISTTLSDDKSRNQTKNSSKRKISRREE